MLLSCRRLHLPSLVVIWLVCSGVAAGTSPLCPASCTCRPSDRGKRRISCLAGGLTDPIPTGQMDPRTEVLEISAPEDRKNWLSVTSMFQHFKHLEELHITNSNINQISMHAFWGIPSLKILDLGLNNISSLFDHNFRGLVNLIDLNLDANRIAALPSGVFKHLTELRTLSLQRNLLRELVPRTFLKLVKLHALRISGNRFEELDPEAFKEIPELRTLECRHCGLRRINTQIYHLLPYLTHLDLGYNRIQFLASDEFQDLHRLHSLKLDGNMFPVILEYTFVNQQQLKYLNLARNRIAKVPDTSLKNLSSLVELDLGYNKLSKTEGLVFVHVNKTLERLVLSGNNLKQEFIKSIVGVLGKVRDLSLAHMKLASVSSGFFPDRIRNLNLSGNNFSEVTVDMFPRQLFSLDLSKNEIKGLNDSVVSFLEYIKRVDITDNPWTCTWCYITDLFFRVNDTNLFQNATCAFPSVLKGKRLTKLNSDEIPSCGLLIGLVCIVTFAVFSVVFVCSCVKRHHRNGERAKRAAECQENNVEHLQTAAIFSKSEISFQFPLDLTERKLSVSTIAEIKKDERQGMSNGTISTGL
ncbi:LOW QUALITY PROTEIN: insulin-like growth factor-binding protein complex acid labile subunit [Sitophilus oryzae]|uniref:LOW QUALITY PROTEIN: insulin-like growth factor-binding protein complex acid labile subunit n=1 Tax=Sitophilus oryzae TaxID=7048 RepID=A0A6J2XQP5_SITOR|nr:LOW QUALITY PROTEIN: insulin-like growth factor-binding protein complex acid labile subunit [Sitophilus oryzae]